jgi:RHS repeat-associated protein
MRPAWAADIAIDATAYDKAGNTTEATQKTGITLETSAAETFIHDDAGCLAQDGSRKYYYDDEHRLVSVTTTGDVDIVLFTYDALGRRIQKVVCDQYGDPETTIRYVYNGLNVIEEYVWDGVEEEWDLDAEYVQGLGIDNVLSIERDSSRWYYHHDGLGSVTELTDESGDLSQAYEYDAWGNATIYDPDHASGNTYLYTGREWDAEIGLYYYRARHYAPTLGRFIQPDPQGYVDGPNMYAYVGSCPVALRDPSGLQQEEIKKHPDPQDVEVGEGNGFTQETAAEYTATQEWVNSVWGSKCTVVLFLGHTGDIREFLKDKEPPDSKQAFRAGAIGCQTKTMLEGEPSMRKGLGSERVWIKDLPKTVTDVGQGQMNVVEGAALGANGFDAFVQGSWEKAIEQAKALCKVTKKGEDGKRVAVCKEVRVMFMCLNVGKWPAGSLDLAKQWCNKEETVPCGDGGDSQTSGGVTRTVLCPWPGTRGVGGVPGLASGTSDERPVRSPCR